MSYKLQFLPSALKEWNKIGSTIREQLKKKLRERLEKPVVPADRLTGFKNHYKIKLRSAGYRLVYEVVEEEVLVIVITAGKRERSDVLYQSKKAKPMTQPAASDQRRYRAAPELHVGKK